MDLRQQGNRLRCEQRHNSILPSPTQVQNHLTPFSCLTSLWLQHHHHRWWCSSRSSQPTGTKIIHQPLQHGSLLFCLSVSLDNKRSSWKSSFSQNSSLLKRKSSANVTTQTNRNHQDSTVTRQQRQNFVSPYCDITYFFFLITAWKSWVHMLWIQKLTATTDNELRS